jgi:hypothetical protein
MAGQTAPRVLFLILDIFRGNAMPIHYGFPLLGSPNASPKKKKLWLPPSVEQKKKEDDKNSRLLTLRKIAAYKEK